MAIILVCGFSAFSTHNPRAINKYVLYSFTETLSPQSLKKSTKEAKLEYVGGNKQNKKNLTTGKS